jgi:ketosteroid isomerase-like protein
MPDLERTLVDLQHEWMDAWRRDDRARLEEILAPEFTLTSARTDRLVDRAEWLRLLDTTRGVSFAYSDVHVQVFGDAAVVKSRLTQVATVGGQPWNATFMLTDVWVRREGRWQVVSRHSSTPPSKAFEA